MPANLRGARRRADAGPWSRSRLLAMLAGIAVALALLITGLGDGRVVRDLDRHAGTPPRVPASTASGEDVVVSVRDRIAAAPMASVEPDAAFTPDPATTKAPQIVVPVATVEAGPAGVPSGFPRTPEGAVGQLAAIERVVLESMSLPLARDVHRAVGGAGRTGCGGVGD